LYIYILVAWKNVCVPVTNGGLGTQVKPGCFWTGAETQVASQKYRTEKPSLGHGRISPGIRCGANFQFCRRVLCWQWQRHKILDSKLVEWTQHFLEMADPLHLCGPVPNYNISGAEQQ
ncbi:Os03g0842400, partial [Oryza sativa Japonica Group]